MSRLRIRAAVLLGVLPLALGPAGFAPLAWGDQGRPTDLGGTPITGSTDPTDPTELSAGVFADTLGSASEFEDEHHFVYQRTHPSRDSTVHIGVVATSGADSDAVSIKTESCDDDYQTAHSYLPWAAFGTHITVGPSGYDEKFGREERQTSCLGEEVRFTIGRNGATGDLTDLPISIKIVEESPIEQPAELEPVEEPTAPFVPPSVSGKAKALDGAASFADAPLVDDGAYGTTLHEGEERLYRVHVGWGQRLAVRATVSPPTGPGLEDRYVSTAVRLELFDPLRNVFDEGLETTESGSISAEEGVELTNAAGPVNYLDRYEPQPTYLPGDHYIAFAVQAPDEGESPLAVQVQLEVEVQGDETSGPPYVDDEPFLVGDGERSTVASGIPSATEDDAGRGQRLAAVGLGVFGLVCCAGGLLVLRR